MKTGDFSMYRAGRAVYIFSCFLISSATLFAQHTYYISKSTGSDSNTATQAQSKSTPWAHLPGMQAGCISNCKSYSPIAGDRFILKGGDTWGSSDLGGVNITYSGSSTSPIYIGVDQTWFAGASWTRPVWSCQNTNCGDSSATLGNVVWLAGNYLMLDNIELTGYKYDGGGNVISTYGNNINVEHCYIHGWSRTSGATSMDPYAISMNWSNFAGEGTGTVYYQNVIDGSDSPNQDFMGGILHGSTVEGNVIRYVYNGMNGVFNVIDGNLVEYNYVSASGDHCNMIFPQGIFSGNILQISNNVVRHAQCNGGTTIFVMANSSCTACTSYIFNNLLYDNEVDSDKGFSIGGPNANGNFYYYNNTVVTAGGYCMQNGSQGTGTAYYANFHCISPQPICNFLNGTCNNNGGNLSQTAAQADANTSPHFDQYTATETYAYSPVASTNSTVGGGSNLATSCSGAMATLCSDASYATYNTSNHAVSMRTTNKRPGSGPWDVGAYAFSTGGSSPGVSSPSSLTVTVE